MTAQMATASNMELMNDRDAQRLLEDAELVVHSTGTTRLLLRQPLPPDDKVSPNFTLDPDYKSPNIVAAKIPYRERILEAKIRSMNDYEISTTGVGELQIGDLVAAVDPSYYQDPIQPIQLMDEIRFAEKIFIQGAGNVERGWDYLVHGIHPAWAKNTCIQLKLILRRKAIATPGGSKLPSV